MASNGAHKASATPAGDVSSVRPGTQWQDLYEDEIRKRKAEITEISRKKTRAKKVSLLCVLSVAFVMLVLWSQLPATQPADTLTRADAFLVIVQALTLLTTTIVAVLSFVRHSVAGNEERAREHEFQLMTGAIEAQRGVERSIRQERRARIATIRGHIATISNHMVQLEGLIGERDEAEADSDGTDGATDDSPPRIRIPTNLKPLVDQL